MQFPFSCSLPSFWCRFDSKAPRASKMVVSAFQACVLFRDPLWENEHIFCSIFDSENFWQSTLGYVHTFELVFVSKGNQHADWLTWGQPNGWEIVSLKTLRSQVGEDWFPEQNQPDAITKVRYACWGENNKHIMIINQVCWPQVLWCSPYQQICCDSELTPYIHFPLMKAFGHLTNIVDTCKLSFFEPLAILISKAAELITCLFLCLPTCHHSQIFLQALHVLKYMNSNRSVGCSSRRAFMSPLTLEGCMAIISADSGERLQDKWRAIPAGRVKQPGIFRVESAEHHAVEPTRHFQRTASHCMRVPRVWGVKWGSGW